MEPIDRRLILAGAGLAGVAAFSKLAKAGPLGPPPGPISPTGRTIQQVYDKIARGGDQGTPEARIPVQGLPGSQTAQFVIDQPGCYYLNGNITGEPGKCCIEVRADQVELECDGFTFIGVAGTLSCIRAVGGGGTPPSPLRCLGVYDAGFKGWQGRCIDAEDCDDACVEECWFDSCVSPGSAGTAAGACCALGAGGVIYDCDSRRCFGCTMSVGRRGVIEECVCSDGFGGAACFVGTDDCVIEDNYAMDCDGAAIVVQDRGTVLYNRCSRCADGVRIMNACVACENDLDLSIGSTGNGVTVGGARCCVSGNCCGGGGGGGCGIMVMVGGDGTLIEDNHVVGAGGPPGVGEGQITVQQGVTRCHVVCNRVRRGSIQAFSIPPGNSYGPIAVVPDAGDMGGVAAAGHPWANFAY